MPKRGISDIFLDNVQINNEGWTDIIYLEDLIKIDSRFCCNNGCQWARKGSKLDNNYNLVRIHANDIGGKGNKVIAIQLQGFKNKKENHFIPLEVKKALKGKPCVVLGVVTSDMEIDHKNE